MKEIKELDMNKYLVLKWDDIDILLDSEQYDISGVIQRIGTIRQKEGKAEHKYLVLNFDDEIDLDYFEQTYKNCSDGDGYWGLDGKIKVSKIALALVNAIQRAKEKL